MKPFNLEEALAGKPVVTRDGRPVSRIVYFEGITGYCVYAVIDAAIGKSVSSFTKEGKYDRHRLNDEVPEDLFMAADKVTRYTNAYLTSSKNIFLSGSYDNEHEAALAAFVSGLPHNPTYLGAFPVEITL